jgi:hypothetical protein
MNPTWLFPPEWTAADQVFTDESNMADWWIQLRATDVWLGSATMVPYFCETDYKCAVFYVWFQLLFLIANFVRFQVFFCGFLILPHLWGVFSSYLYGQLFFRILGHYLHRFQLQFMVAVFLVFQGHYGVLVGVIV